jgi:hypothetical protein
MNHAFLWTSELVITAQALDNFHAQNRHTGSQSSAWYNLQFSLFFRVPKGRWFAATEVYQRVTEVRRLLIPSLHHWTVWDNQDVELKFRIWLIPLVYIERVNFYWNVLFLHYHITIQCWITDKAPKLKEWWYGNVLPSQRHFISCIEIYPW